MNKKDKSPLEQTLLAGLHGAPELKREERARLLGQFRERVLKVLTFSQISEPGTYPEINQAIKDPRASRLIISRRADLPSATDYIRLARQQGLTFTTVHLPEFKGPVGLVVTSDQAVDEEEITVADRTQRLLDKGLPQELIQAKGKGVCKKCLQLIKEKAPEELKNYRGQSLLDRLLGNKCQCK